MAFGIYERRFYTPVRDIVLDLLNRRERLTDATALEDSRASLEYMLSEFLEDNRRRRGRGGGGGGSAADDRAAKLAAVSRAYESEIKRGALRNIVQGKLVRLILIQVQLLKTEMLKAMGAIDDLVDANRLNVQLLASLPAFVLLGFGSRAGFKLVNVVRTQGLRSMRQVHEEMGGVLGRLEHCLLLAGSPRPQAASSTLGGGGDDDCGGNGGNGIDEPSSSSGARSGSQEEDDTHADAKEAAAVGSARGSQDGRLLQGAELGEFSLQLHSYLLLLDFSSSAYASRASDALHHELQDLLRQGQLSVTQQSAMLASLKERHAALARSLK